MTQISAEVFDQQRRPRFGTSNPERMRLEFWEWMIIGRNDPAAEQGRDLGRMIREGTFQHGHGPYQAHTLFDVGDEAGPIWTFYRMGITYAELPDGRVVCVGGEYDDSGDPDFFIYNDVIVLGPGDRIEIYGYPRDVFPPTDFHTATLIGDQIVNIGCLGYGDDRRPGQTPVYSLDLSDFRIAQIPTTGQAPGWVFKHQAEVGSQGVITIKGGEVLVEQAGVPRFLRNLEDYALDTRSGVWTRLTNRNWRQFVIEPEGQGWPMLGRWPDRELLFPRSVEYVVEPCEGRYEIRFLVRGVPVSVTVDTGAIEVIIEGVLPDDLVDTIVEEIRANAEADVGLRWAVGPT